MAVAPGASKDVVIAGERGVVGSSVQVVHRAYRLVRLPWVAHELSIILESLERTFMDVQVQTSYYILLLLLLITQTMYILVLTRRDRVAMQSEETETHGRVIDVLHGAALRK